MLAFVANDTIVKADGATTTFRSLFDVCTDIDSEKPACCNLFDQLVEERPLSQIAIPHLMGKTIDEYQGDIADLPIAYVPENYELNGVRQVDAVGNEQVLSATEQPDNFVILVSQNERMMLLPNEKEIGALELGQHDGKAAGDCDIGDVYMTGFGTFVTVENFFDQLSCTLLCLLAIDPIPETALCPRSDRGYRNSRKDYLHRFKFANFREFEKYKEPSWTDSYLEFMVDIVIVSNNTGLPFSLRNTFNVHHRDLVDRGWFRRNQVNWITVNKEVVTWNLANYGSTMFYNWIEYDGGPSTVSTTFNFTGMIPTQNPEGGSLEQEFTINLQFTNDDDQLGNTIVEYCDKTDDEGFEYRAGPIVFNVNQ